MLVMKLSYIVNINSIQFTCSTIVTLIHQCIHNHCYRNYTQFTTVVNIKQKYKYHYEGYLLHFIYKKRNIEILENRNTNLQTMLRIKPKPQMQKAAKSNNQTSGKRFRKYPKIGTNITMQNPLTSTGAGIKTKCFRQKGVLILKEIREYQCLTKLLLSKISVYRVMQEVTNM